MDLPLLVTTAGLVNNALSSLKSARDFAKIVGNADLKEEIAAAYDALQDLRERALDLDEENRQPRRNSRPKPLTLGPSRHMATSTLPKMGSSSTLCAQFAFSMCRSKLAT